MKTSKIAPLALLIPAVVLAQAEPQAPQRFYATPPVMNQQDNPTNTTSDFTTAPSDTSSNLNLSTTGFRPPIVISSDLPTGMPDNQQIRNNNTAGSSAGDKESNVGGIYMCFNSSGKTTSKK